MSRLAISGVAAALAASALAQPAAAQPMLQADQPCYTPGEHITVTGTGYTPAGNVGVFFSLSGAHGHNILGLRDPVVADSGGNIRTTMPAPDLASSDDTQEDVFASANDMTQDSPDGAPNPAAVGLTQFKLSTWDVFVAPWERHVGTPGKLATLRAYGWEPMTTLWAHYFRGARKLADVRIGALAGDCGNLRRTIRQFPFRPVPAGSYTIYFSGARAFDRRRDVWIDYTHVRVPASRAVR